MVFEMIRDLLSECIGCEADRIRPATVILEDLEADMQDLTSVMMGLEEALPIAWDVEDLSQLTTVADLVRFVEEQV